MSETIIWRCRHCRKWSHARRRPPYHQRFVAGDETAVDYERYGEFVWCGPFDRFVAYRHDPQPPHGLDRLGLPVNHPDIPEPDRIDADRVGLPISEPWLF